MSQPEVDINYFLSLEEQEKLISDCERLACDLFGPPDRLIGQDLRSRRLSNGTRVNLARTAIQYSEEQIGFRLDLRIFVAEQEIDPDPEESFREYEGNHMSLQIDLTQRKITRSEGFGNLEIDYFGDDELEIEGDLDTHHLEPGDNYDLSNVFSDSNIEAVDYLKLNDIIKILLGEGNVKP